MKEDIKIQEIKTVVLKHTGQIIIYGISTDNQVYKYCSDEHIKGWRKLAMNEIN